MQHEAFGGGATQTALHPWVLVAMIIAIGLMLVLRRRDAVVPFLLIVLLTPLGQVLVVNGSHWMVPRIVSLFGLLRLVKAKFTSKETLLAGGWSGIDKIFLFWALSQAVCFTLLYESWDAAVNQCGFLLDVLGPYLILRHFIRDEADSWKVVKALVIVIIVVGAGMVYEQLTLQNVFGVLGGVPSVPAIREGRIRSQGVFQHAILAGVFGATILPYLLTLLRSAKSSLLVLLGLGGATIMVYTSSSSTPLLTYFGGALALCLWPIRKNMRMVRWILVITIIGLAFIMKAPIWFIISHIDVVGSSSGYQRAMLIDVFMRHFSDWWLLGAKNLEDWGWDMWDVQNQFVAQGETGGLFTFVLFIGLVSHAFTKIGRARRASEGSRQQEWFYWTLGAVLFAHVVAFFGANYFDQIKVEWFSLLAIIAATTSVSRRPALETSEASQPEGVPDWDYRGAVIQR